MRVRRFARFAAIARRTSLALGSLATPACVDHVPDPHSARDAYVKAIKRRDVDALYALGSERSHRAISREQFRATAERNWKELDARALAFSNAQTVVEAKVENRYDDGESAFLTYDGTRFYVAAAGAIPGGALSPSQALADFRRSLARRNFDAMIRVLSPDTRARVERDLETLVSGLTQPDSLPAEVVGDIANVEVPGGHRVRLRRDRGYWFVEEFE